MSLGSIDGVKLPLDRGIWRLTEEDFLVYAMLTDPIYMPELLWRDPVGRDYAGGYRVRDYQYQINRCEENAAIFACGRSTGKTESAKVHAQIHTLEAEGENMLITAPELIHLLPLTDAIEDNLRSSRLVTESLDTRGQKTGFTHRPFGVNLLNGTKIVGRIPKLTGQGVKGQHQPFLLMDESQDYPPAGWTEIQETLNADAVDKYGKPRWRFWAYGVHSGDRSSGFAERAKSGAFTTIQVTALMRPDWGKERKEMAVAAYGGTSSPDYRRNILGEPGAAASAYFVISRLMSTVDQQVERGEVSGSDYNVKEYKTELFRYEEMEDLGLSVAEAIDLPSNYKSVHVGVDLGLTSSPTVISLFTETMVEKKMRLKLFRRISLERFRPRQIREVLYAIAWTYGGALMSVGIDSTGLGLPIFQDIEDDEIAPPHLLDVARGYFFNSKVPVNVSPEHVFRDESSGVVRDQYGNMVKEETLPDGSKRFVTMTPFISASTGYLRNWVDSGYLMLPFDTEVISDMMQETRQRVDRLSQSAERGSQNMRKGNAFHILDSFRAMAMAYHASEIEEVLAIPQQKPVLDAAL